MKGKQCKLYDENLVRNIMISTGMSIAEYLKNCERINTLDVCNFVEHNAQNIINSTIADMNHDCGEFLNLPPNTESPDLGTDKGID